MAKWHLCSPLGVSERTTDADDLFWAKRRFAPIPKGWHVISDASYRTPAYQVDPSLIDRCSKCNRNPAVEGTQQCHDCAAHKRNAYRKTKGIRGKNAKSDTRSASLRRAYDNETPEQKEARRERLRLAAIAYQERKLARRRAAEKNILRGIELRRAGRNDAAARERNRPAELKYHRARRAQLSLGL
jgi:hypothetical protein